jgi:hypothetical protein
MQFLLDWGIGLVVFGTDCNRINANFPTGEISFKKKTDHVEIKI